ncbi:MAG: hypothetical protein ACLPQS_10055 [Acidimicrobiales bacterium]
MPSRYPRPITTPDGLPLGPEAAARWRDAAVMNNALWCDLVCRSHGLPTIFGAEAWASRSRTPTYYPDAVTLVPRPSIPGLLALIDASPGCSVKDSFATLDLSGVGFQVLMDAEWIVRSSDLAPVTHICPPWQRVAEPSALVAWEDAWRETGGPRNVFRASLLENEAVAVVAAYEAAEVVAGAILNASGSDRGTPVVGVSNLFSRLDVAATAWSGCLAIAQAHFPGAAVVGYESGEQLTVARGLGFDAVGPLRVWKRED